MWNTGHLRDAPEPKTGLSASKGAEVIEQFGILTGYVDGTQECS